MQLTVTLRQKSTTDKKSVICRLSIKIDGIGDISGIKLMESNYSSSENWLAMPSKKVGDKWESCVVIEKKVEYQILKAIKGAKVGDKVTLDADMDLAEPWVYINPFSGGGNCLAMGNVSFGGLLAINSCAYYSCTDEDGGTKTFLKMPGWYIPASGANGTYVFLENEMNTKLNKQADMGYSYKMKSKSTKAAGVA